MLRALGQFQACAQHPYLVLFGELSHTEQSCRDTGRASPFAHRSCWDGGILELVQSQLRGGRGIGSPLLHSGGNRLEGRMWGSTRKKGFCVAGGRGRVMKMQQALCRCHRSKKGQREQNLLFQHLLIPTCFQKSQLYTYCFQFPSFPSFDKNLQGFFPFPFPFYPIMFVTAPTVILSQGKWVLHTSKQIIFHSFFWIATCL